MKKKYKIEVRQYGEGQTQHGCSQGFGGDFGYYETIAIIDRVLRAESIGNFNPVFCTYNHNKRVMVHSDAFDLSDPFRGESTELFIKV